MNSQAKPTSGEHGFTLIEMIIALVILFIAVMGVFAAFTYATRYNHGNSQRSQAISVMQREVELLRSAKFTPSIVSNIQFHQFTAPACSTGDPDTGERDLTGGTREVEYRCGIDGTVYEVRTTIDDNPATPTGTPDAYPWPTPVPAPSPAATPPIALMKQITVEVTPVSPEGQTSAGAASWVTANPVRVVFRRVRAN